MNSLPESMLRRPQRWPLMTRLYVVLAGLLVLAVPVVYLAFLLSAAGALGWGALAAFERWALEPGWGWVNITSSVGLGVGVMTWAWFFRPFWVRGGQRKSSLEVKRPDQPEWFETVAMAVVQARAPMPEEVHLDAGGEIRLDSVGAFGGLAGGRHRLTVGAMWIGVCTEGQLIADLVSSLARSPQGLAGRCYWLVRSMTEWLERAARVGDDQVGRTAKDQERTMGGLVPKRRRRAWYQREWMQKMWKAYLWLTQRPIWLMLLMSRAVTAPALRHVMYAGDLAAASLLGAAGYEDLLGRKQRMRRVVGEVEAKLEGGIRDGRLPDNLVLQGIREMERGGQAEKDGEQGPDDDRRIRRVRRWKGEALIATGGTASFLVRRFQEICRQVTQMHYQQDLALALNQFRLVAGGESSKKATEADTTYFDIQRYFAGLAHPHRPLCGLVNDAPGRPTAGEMRKQIQASKRQMVERGDQVRTVQREWAMAWQRCRDLEMAHAMALAGMPLDPRQYGLMVHDARTYRDEIARQAIVMEHSDEALRSIEVDFERRLAAALGLVMTAGERALPEGLRKSAAELPLWGGAYGVLCAKLPVLWQTLNWVYAFEALGVEADTAAFKHSSADGEMHSQRAALDFLVPHIASTLGRLLEGLERVAAPVQPEVSMAWWLTDGMVIERPDTEEQRVKLGRAAAGVTERCLKLHQTVFAWLCRLAEAGEEALGEEVRTEAGFSRAEPGCDLGDLGHVGACVPVSATSF
jgi:hypothetical protein